MCRVIKVPFLVVYSILLLFTSVKAFAGIESTINRRVGPFAAGDTLSVKDDKFLSSRVNWNSVFNHSVKNAITLRVVDNTFIKTAFTYSITFKVQYYTGPDTAGHALMTNPMTLTVSYDPTTGTTYKGTDSYIFPAGTNAYKMTIKVVSTINPAGIPLSNHVVELSGSIVIDRSYFFLATAKVNMSYTQDSTKILTSWSQIIGAEEYDLEWTTINNGNPLFARIQKQHAPVGGAPGARGPIRDTVSFQDTLEQVFTNNSTRITTSENGYAVPILTTDDYLLIRIRQVQYADGVRKAGDWTYRTATDFVIIDAKWHQPTLNWQYSAAFAEDGKKKEVISYFDGTLRGRQTVTINNSDAVEVVQENIYDEFGRPTASILPAPAYESTGVPYLHYITKFNQNGSGRSYNFANVAGTVGFDCEPMPDSLNAVAGASKYYSVNNAFNVSSNYGYKTFNKFAPRANGYPLSVTQYAADNTGRIKMQGGVGPEFQPGTGDATHGSRTTKYFYGKPEQWELDQLFGNDVGFAEHYMKNMVVDPNGQVSVSYLNASGKTIATALAGTPPQMMDSISSIRPIRSQKTVVLQPSQFIYDATALKFTASTTYLATIADTTPMVFNIRKLIDQYPGGVFKICSNCYYKLSLKVTDDCGETVLNTSAPVQIGSSLSNPADTGTYQAVISPTPFFGHVGAYYISVELAFDDDVINSYTDNFVTQGQNSGYLEKQFGYIKKRYLDSLDLSGAFADCHTCNQLLGTQADFTNALKSKFLTLNIDTSSLTITSFTHWSDSLYTALKAKCTASQAHCDYAPCNSVQSVMEEDVSPGGQYALFDVDDNPLEPTINVLARADSAGIANWRVIFKPISDTSSTVYKSELITQDDGSITSPYATDFSLNQLVKYWKPEWAVKFLKYHPEYCKLEFCQKNASYKNWDEYVKLIDAASGVPSIPGASLTFSSGKAADWLLAADSAFKVGGVAHDYYSQMQADLLHYSKNIVHLPNSLTERGLTGWVDYLLYCADPAGNTNLTSGSDNWTNCSPNADCRVLDREWASYRDLYFELKQKYYDILSNNACGNTGSCAIGIVSEGGGIAGSAINGSVASGSAPDGDDDSPCTSGTPDGNIYFRVFDRESTIGSWCPEDGGAADKHITTVTLVNSLGCPMSASGSVTVSVRYLVTRFADDDVNKFDTHDFTFTGGNTSLSYTYDCNTNEDDNHLYVCKLDAQPRFIKCVTAASAGLALLHLNSADVIDVCSSAVPVHTGGGYTPPTADCSAWAKKRSRFPTYQNLVPGLGNVTSASVLSTGQKDALQDSVSTAMKLKLDTVAMSGADQWLLALDSGFRTITNPTTRDYQRAALKSALIAVSKAGTDSTHIFGASNLEGDPSPGISTYKSFGAAMIGEVTTIPTTPTTFKDYWNPWLIESPYPYKTPAQLALPTISRTDADLCTKLAQYNARAVTAGLSLYTYLVNTFKESMTLTASEVNDLQNACNNCKFMLAKDIELPAFLDKTSRGYIRSSDYFKALDTLASKFASPLDTNSSFYPTILRNFMNQRFGFALTFDDYHRYRTVIATDTTRLLVNRPPYKSMKFDPYGTAKSLMASAVNNGIEAYINYINFQRAVFRLSYTSVCRLANPSLTLTTRQRQYHYTLYYYDQADNLVRTVPPEGVAPVDTGYFKLIDTARKRQLSLDTTGLALYNALAPYLMRVNQKDTAFNRLSAALASTSPRALEFWLYSPTGGSGQLIERTTDGNYLFQICSSGGKLSVEVYTSTTHSSNSVTYSLSNKFMASVSTTLPLWSHIVVQGSSLWSSAMQVYLNGVALSPLPNPPPSDCSWSITSGATSVTYPDNISTLKHLRIYNRLMLAAEITANARNAYMAPSIPSSMAWFRFNVPAAGSTTTIGDTSTTEVALNLVYPDHVLRTNYAYNATNQVVKQNSPDGGTNKFWYDILSRLNISQNDKQASGSFYGYTRYDGLGRITEVGQKMTTTVPADPDYLPDATIQTFNNITSTNGQITNTYYDGQVPALSGLQTTLAMNNQRKRVSATTYTDTVGAAVKQATYYDYDQDGNVKTLWQQVDELGIKRIDYEYDLISGKVNFVRYQDNRPDRFYYKYKYDAENRLTQAWGGTEAMVNPNSGSELLAYNARMDASYYYYLHGPLARMELGDLWGKVQGTDYAYTLQGWLKGVNSTQVTPAQDMGGDGRTGTTIPQDAYGYALYYHGNGSTKLDYRPLDGSQQPFETVIPQNATFRALYNGNIAASSINLPRLSTKWFYNYYRYDQLNRLTLSQLYNATGPGTAYTATTDHKEAFTYDANGNIKTLVRNGNTLSGNNKMDSLIYHYNTDSQGRLTNNKLTYLSDLASDANWQSDLKDQATGNYKYDAIGNVTGDVKAGLRTVSWTVYGKIRTKAKTSGDFSYYYNSSGQRTKKTAAGLNTYYVRDAQGNTLAIYDNKNGNTNWREQHLYGSSRLGMWQPNLRLGTDSSRIAWDTLGNKQYELTNHLGNVMATITDRRLQQHDAADTSLLYLTPDVATAQEYYAFGSLLQGKRFTADTSYRYGFNGKENDNDIKGTGNEQDYGMRIYEPRLGRFMSVDPLQHQYPELTSYQFSENTPIQAVDLDGKEADFTKAKVPLLDYNKGDNAESNINTFGLNTVLTIYNGVVDMVEMGTNYNPITNIIYKGKGYGKLYDMGKTTVAGAYDWTVNTTWGEKGTDLKNTGTNPHTYEAIIALVITHKLGKLAGQLLKPELPAIPKTDVPVEKIELEPYKDGGGHHVPAKSAFEGDPNYSAKKALAIPKRELARLGLEHPKITGIQMKLYKAFAATGATLTWDVMAKIETKVLVTAGLEEGIAQREVTNMINALKESGVTNPTRIPWDGK